ncbi:hypothetical protein ACFOWU_04850 [Epilithonimonas zeae]|uniref:Uncharacterized protein n=1 Tax=Epilithonimonas zeae TaxID=1416779 RepID=A0A1N6F3D8_9FLAO|nr:hypothetical protein [Epilithonimonas zeae]SIN89781.1 hypothetical protein SAMN05444409_1024 [Epilithonimonas zeae]
MNLKSFLKIEIKYWDGSIFLEICASNTYFMGETLVFAEDKELIDFSNKLLEFPKNHNDNVFFELGRKELNDSYFSINFYSADSISHIGVQITMETEMHLREQEKYKVQFEIIVEPNAIDEFRKSIYSITQKNEGTAILYGRDN